MNRVQSDSYWYDTGYKTAKIETIDRVTSVLDMCKINEDSKLYPEDAIFWTNRALEQAKQVVLALKGGD